MDGGQVWPPEPESGTDYAGARGGRFRKFLKGSVGKLRVLPAGTRSGVGTRHGLRGAPPKTWGDVGMRHGPGGPPPPGRGAMSARGMGCGEPPNPEPRGAAPTPSRGEPLQDAKRCQHGAQAAGSPPPGRGATLS